MYLSKEEKQEMLEDAQNESRRKDFAYAKKFPKLYSQSLEEYILFLNSIQKFYSFPHVPKKTIATFNKL